LRGINTGTRRQRLTGALIQNVPGARGFELGFALCGALMVAGGLLGLWMIDPGRSVRYAT
jgi:hypothetical protein